jgi:DeoR family transcriptional regulator, fructose operon transcriptional repressor
MSVNSVDRLEQIRARLATAGLVRVSELAGEFGVSEMTVRRDLDALGELGIAQRVRGGALALGPQQFADRYGHQGRAKDEIVGKLLDLVGDGGAIGIDASTTLQRLAARLGAARDLTVLTNSLEALNVLSAQPGVVTLLTGGRLDPRTGSLVGPLATGAARDMLLRRLFVSATGIDPRHGITEMTLEEAEVKRAFAEVSGQIIVAVDSTKLGHRGAARSLSMEQIDILVTELPPDDARLKPYRDHCEIL